MHLGVITPSGACAGGSTVHIRSWWPFDAEIARCAHERREEGGREERREEKRKEKEKGRVDLASHSRDQPS